MKTNILVVDDVLDHYDWFFRDLDTFAAEFFNDFFYCGAGFFF